MPLLISDLKTLLTSGPELNISPDYLELENAGPLFHRFFKDGQLHVKDKSADLEALIAEGKVPINGQALSNAHIIFIADNAGKYLAGIRVDVTLLPEGAGLPSEIAHVPAALDPLERGPLHLVFGIEPDGSPRVGLGAELLFPTQATEPHPYVWAYPPAKPTQPWNFFGFFKDVSLDSTDQLNKICSGDFKLPDGVPSKGLTLSAMALDVVPGPDVVLSSPGAMSSQWLSLGIGLKLSGQWEIWPGVLKIKELDGSFAVADPRGKPTISVVIGGRVNLTEAIDVDVTVMLPGKSLQGSLAGTLRVGALLEKMFGEIPLLENLTVSRLVLAAELGSERGYFLDLDLEHLSITESLQLSKVGLRVAKEADKVAATISAAWQVGKTALTVTGTWSSTGGWIFTTNSPDPGITLTDMLSAMSLSTPDILRAVSPRLTTLNLAYQPTRRALSIQAKTNHFSFAFTSFLSS
ncbi:hypothetical protein [Streptomyces wuyuanensis]|uniref:hypothetical protein n=1 Tax=Streptomyces wuyuanensis TaxID=1196353 RepID=UPI0034354B86